MAEQVHGRHRPADETATEEVSWNTVVCLD